MKDITVNCLQLRHHLLLLRKFNEDNNNITVIFVEMFKMYVNQYCRNANDLLCRKIQESHLAAHKQCRKFDLHWMT